MADIFDQITETKEQDIFDQIAPDVMPEKAGAAKAFGAELGKGFVSEWLRTGRLALEVGERFKEKKVPWWLPGIRATQELAEWTGERPIIGPTTEEAIENIKSAETKFAQTHPGTAAFVGRTIGQVIPQTMQSLAAASVGGAPFAATLIGGKEFQGAYDEARAAGESEEQATKEAALVGTINAVLEFWGVSNLLKFKEAGKGSFRGLINSVRQKMWKQAKGDLANIGSNALKSSIVEGLEEISQEGVSLAVPAVVSSRWPTKPDGTPDWATMIERISLAGVGGAIAGGLVTTGAAAITPTIEAAAPTTERIEAAARQVQQSNMSAYAKARTIEGLQKLSSTIGKKIETVSIEELPERGIGMPKKEWQKQLESIKKEGIKEPIIIDPDTGKVLDGVRRIALAREAGIKEVPVKYIKTEDYETLIPSPFEIPDSARQTLDVSRRLADEILVPLESTRPELKQEIKEKRSKDFKEQENILESMQDNDPVTAKRVAQSAAKGYLRSQFPDAVEKFSQDDYRLLVRAVNESTNISSAQKRELWDALDDLFVRKLPPSKSRVKAFDDFFGTGIFQKTKRIRPLRKKIWDNFIDVLNIPKAIRASCDFSFPLRQGWAFAMAHPIKALPAFGKQIRAFFSDEYCRLAELEIQTNPLFPEFKRRGLQITQVGHRTKGEEYFVSQLAHKIPWIGKLVQASDRAFVTAGNELRMRAATYYYEDWLGSNQPEYAYQQMVNFVNHATGRGGGGRFERWSPELGAMFWAPRLQLGRVQTIADLGKKHIRKMVAHELLRAIAGSLLALSMIMALYGATVEPDPRSSDWGKGKIGNTRIDFWGGNQQIARAIIQLIWRERKATATGRISDTTALEILTRFLRSKLSPQAGLTADIVTGETFLGKKWRWEPEFLSDYLSENIAPLFLQDLKDAIQYQGLSETMLVAPLAIHGVGAQTYEVTSSGEAMKIKNHYAHEVFGADWDELGPEVQSALREYKPLIDIYEDRARREREDYTFVGKRVQEEQEAGRRVYKALPKNIQGELDRLDVDVKGLGRYISSGWYLNKERHKQYEKDLKTVLQKTISRLIASPAWKRFNPDIQQTMLQTIVDESKKYVRQNIITEVNMKDIERLQP